MHTLLSLSFFFLSLFILSSLSQTTPHIYEVFMGNCYQKNPSNTNCSLLWETFSYGAKQDNTRVNSSYYEDFFSVANFSSPPDGSLFWSGNKDFANVLSNGGDTFTTLEETSTGFTLNGLSWCGLPYSPDTPPDFDYVNPCQYSQNATYYGMQGVWEQCSASFAKNAMGNVTLLLEPVPLYYSYGPYLAYRNTSIFATVEFPNWDISKLKSIRILVLKNPDQAPTEKCGSGSLKVLTQRIWDKFQFAPTCVDDPKQLINILCNEQEKTPECIVALYAQLAAANPNTQLYFDWALATSVTTGIAIIAIIFLGTILLQTRAKLVSKRTPLLRGIE